MPNAVAPAKKASLFKGNSATRASFLSGSEDADFDIRKACNTLKRMTAVATACTLTGADPQEMAARVEEIAVEVLRNLGFSTDNLSQMGALLGMVCEPISLVVAEAALVGATADELRESAHRIVAAMTGLARSKGATKLIVERYPLEITTATALRMSAAAAITPVALEVGVFDFCIGEPRCIKEASRVIMDAAFEAADFLAAEESSSQARAMLTQSLLHSAGKMYATCYRIEANVTQDALEAMTDGEQAAALELLAHQKPVNALQAASNRFHTLFDSCINVYADMPELPVRPAAATPATRRLRP